MTTIAPSEAGRLGLLADDLAAASLAMARRFHAGGTMWCISPTWAHHARHVAVEFVHPVIVGKRALPAVMLPGVDLVQGVRVSAAPGDIVLAIGAGDDEAIGEIARRAPAWGVHVLWVGCGPRPTSGAADHVLWFDKDLAAADNGRFILLYHLLWELTHVCFEHRDLLEVPLESDREVCITCSDEGVLAEVVTTDGARTKVRTGDGERTIDTTLVGNVLPDDLLLVHAGTAIARVDEERRP